MDQGVKRKALSNVTQNDKRPKPLPAPHSLKNDDKPVPIGEPFVWTEASSSGPVEPTLELITCSFAKHCARRCHTSIPIKARHTVPTGIAGGSYSLMTALLVSTSMRR